MGGNASVSKRNWKKDNLCEGEFIARVDRFLDTDEIKAALRAVNEGKSDTIAAGVSRPHFPFSNAGSGTRSGR